MTTLLVVKDDQDNKLLSRVIHKDKCVPEMKEKMHTEAVRLFELDSSKVDISMNEDWNIADLVA